MYISSPNINVKAPNDEDEVNDLVIRLVESNLDKQLELTSLSRPLKNGACTTNDDDKLSSANTSQTSEIHGSTWRCQQKCEFPNTNEQLTGSHIFTTTTPSYGSSVVGDLGRSINEESVGMHRKDGSPDLADADNVMMPQRNSRPDEQVENGRRCLQGSNVFLGRSQHKTDDIIQCFIDGKADAPDEHRPSLNSSTKEKYDEEGHSKQHLLDQNNNLNNKCSTEQGQQVDLVINQDDSSQSHNLVKKNKTRQRRKRKSKIAQATCFSDQNDFMSWQQTSIQERNMFYFNQYPISKPLVHTSREGIANFIQLGMTMRDSMKKLLCPINECTPSMPLQDIPSQDPFWQRSPRPISMPCHPGMNFNPRGCSTPVRFNASDPMSYNTDGYFRRRTFPQQPMNTYLNVSEGLPATGLAPSSQCMQVTCYEQRQRHPFNTPQQGHEQQKLSYGADFQNSKQLKSSQERQFSQAYHSDVDRWNMQRRYSSMQDGLENEQFVGSPFGYPKPTSILTDPKRTQNVARVQYEQENGAYVQRQEFPAKSSFILAQNEQASTPNESHVHSNPFSASYNSQIRQPNKQQSFNIQQYNATTAGRSKSNQRMIPNVHLTSSRTTSGDNNISAVTEQRRIPVLITDRQQMMDDNVLDESRTISHREPFCGMMSSVNTNTAPGSCHENGDSSALFQDYSRLMEFGYQSGQKRRCSRRSVTEHFKEVSSAEHMESSNYISSLNRSQSGCHYPFDLNSSPQKRSPNFRKMENEAKKAVEHPNAFQSHHGSVSNHADTVEKAFGSFTGSDQFHAQPSKPHLTKEQLDEHYMNLYGSESVCSNEQNLHHYSSFVLKSDKLDSKANEGQMRKRPRFEVMVDEDDVKTSKKLESKRTYEVQRRSGISDERDKLALPSTEISTSEYGPRNKASQFGTMTIHPYDEASQLCNVISTASLCNGSDTFFITCANCDKRAIYLCSSCRSLAFCSRSCQEYSWHSHKDSCLRKGRILMAQGAN